MTDLKDIIESLEKATGGSPELDEAIFHAVYGDDPIASPWRRFSSSVDAALTLVPEGFDAQVIWRGASAPAHCRGGAVVSQPTKSWSKKDRGEICATSHHKATPALALCIAALKSHLALRPLPEPPK